MTTNDLALPWEAPPVHQRCDRLSLAVSTIGPMCAGRGRLMRAPQAAAFFDVPFDGNPQIGTVDTT